jgi:acetyltransferase-like isoleucine patch superfamily enzyme
MFSHFIRKLLACWIPNRRLRNKFRHWLRRPPCRIGEYTYYANDFFVYNKKETTVGKYTSIARHVTIGPSQHELTCVTLSPIITNYNVMGFPELTNKEFLLYKNNLLKNDPYRWHKPVTVGNDVWIGSSVIIQDGLCIGDGAIIGSASVVTKNIPPYAIAVGVPAKVIKFRYDQDTIHELLRLKWWDLPDKFIATLPFHDVDMFIQMAKEYKTNVYQ